MDKFRAFLASHPLHRPRCSFGAIFSGAHFTYFSAVFMEGHGLYSLAGGGLAALMLVGFLLGEEVA